MSGCVLHKTDGSAHHLILQNKGRKNALSLSVLNDLIQAFESGRMREARIVFIRGADGVFCAGADLNDITGTAGDADYDKLTQQVGRLIRNCPAPVVALLEGPCIGAAVELALACDLRVASKDAVLQVPATRLGLLYKPDAIALLGTRFSSETLVRLLVLGERFTAKHALRAGLVGEVVKTTGLLDRVQALSMAADQSGRVAAESTKQLLVALENGTADMAQWQARYLEILSSPARKARVARAKAGLLRKGGSEKQTDAQTPDGAIATDKVGKT
jgi:enoyl-CoA hydratase/carnithine racemase